MSVPRTSSRRLVAVALAVLLGSGLLTACGSEAEPGSAGSPSASPSEAGSSAADDSADASPSQSPSADEGTVVELDLTGDSPAPAESVRVAVGEPVTIAIDASDPGELHVHSTPESEIAYPQGTSEHELVLDRPGVVDVESHDLGVVLARLEVR